MDRTTEEELDLLEQEIEAKEKILLFGAATNGSSDKVKKLVKKGIDVNSLDHYQNSPIDYAWANEFYDVVLLLLKADSKFPKLFNLAQLEDERSIELKHFAVERNVLHRYIEEGNLQGVQKFVNEEKSKFYFNEKNQTAASLAFKTKKRDIYAFLKSTGAEFFDKHEKRKVDNKLEMEDKVALTCALVSHFPPVPGQHILYLISKSRSQEPVERIVENLTNFYTKLDEIPEISVILKTVQYSDYLDIVFDFDNEDVSDLNLLSSKNTRGETNYKEGRLYIAASPKRGDSKILGTIAHEITHMAMQILFENECNPYSASDKKRKDELEQITSKILTRVGKIEKLSSQIIFNVKKSYEVRDYHSELIVTVPQILAEYKNQGREEIQKNFLELYNFFTTKIIPSCQEYVNESPIWKAKIEVKKLNETLGELGKLKKSKILFKNVDGVKNLLNTQNKKIFMLTTKNTFLGLIRTLQAIFGEDYINVPDKYLAFDIVNLIPQILNAMRTFYLDACNTLIIRANDDSFRNKLTDLLEAMSEMFKRKPNKKIIFIINPNLEENLLQGLLNEDLSDLCLKQKQENLYLNDLSEECREKILSLRVKFQDKKIRLKKLLGADENLRKLITGNVIENLIEVKDFQIGGKIISSSYLEVNFAYIDQNINLKTLIYEFKESDDIFVFKGLKEKCELICHFKDFTSKGFIEHEEMSNQIQIIDSQCYEINNKRLILINEMSSESFKEFCHCNCRENIYLIAVEKNGEESRFTLQELYNPNFYLERKFKILIDQDQLKKLISEFKFETFILSKDGFLEKSLEKSYSNIKILTPVEAKSLFDACVKKQKTVHWYHAKDWNEIYFKNSSGFCSDSRLDFRELETDDEFLITQQDVTTYAVNKKIIVIADNPGMGKSTTLTKLYESPVIADTHWVIRLNLKEHIISIKKIYGRALNTETLISFLQLIEPNFKSELTQEFFKSAISLDKALPIAVLFAFDGFDEILDADIRSTIISLLKYLKNNTCSKIWITTRLHYKTVLENELKTFAFQFEPIDEQHRRIYLQSYLQNRLKLLYEREQAHDIFDLKEDSKMYFYTDQFLQHMENIFTKKVSPFIGTPLQLYLMMENSVEHFKNWIDQNTAEPDFPYLGSNILKIFENFIDRKYEIYFKKQNILEGVMREKEREYAEEYHKALAESLIKNTPLSKKHEDINHSVFLIGLIQSHDEKPAEFIHYTFREYFVALSITKNILIESRDLKEKSKYLITLLEKEEFKLIRNFLDILLESMLFVEIPKENIDYLRKHFILLSTSSYQCRILTTLKQIFDRALEEGNKNILDFIVYSCEDYLSEPLCADLLLAPNSRADLLLAPKSRVHVLYWVVFYNDTQILEILFKLIKKLSPKNRWMIMYKSITKKNWVSMYHQNILYVAAKNCHIKVVKMLLTKLNEIFTINEQIQFLNTMNAELNQTVPHTDSSLELKIELKLKKILLNKSKELSSAKLLLENEEIIIMKRDQNGNTVLHLAAMRNNVELMNVLLNKSKELLLFKGLLMAENSSSKTIFHVAVEYGSPDLLNLLITYMSEILSTDEQSQVIMKLDKKWNNVLHLAARRNNTELMKILLNESKNLRLFEDLIKNKNNSSETVFHVATKYGNPNLLNLLITKMNEILSTDEQRQILMKSDKYGRNVFYLAARRNNSELMNRFLYKSKNLPFYEDVLVNENNSLQKFFDEATKYGSPDLLNVPFKKINEILSTYEQRQIKMMCDLNGNNVLHLAAILNNIELMNILLNDSKNLPLFKDLLVNENNSSQTVFHVATENGSPDLLNILFTGINEILPTDERRQIIEKLDQYGDNVLHLAARRNNTELLNILLNECKNLRLLEDLFVNKNDSSQTVFHVAAENGSPDFINILFKGITKILSSYDQRKTIMMRDLNGNDVLHLAARRYHTEVLKIWLNEIKNVRVPNALFENEINSSRTLFHLVTENGSPDLLNVLFKGINEILWTDERRQIIMKPDQYGENILHLAVRRNNTEIMNILLNESKNLQLFEDLIKNKNNSSETVFQLATKYKNPDLLNLIIREMNEILLTEEERKIIMKSDEYGNNVRLYKY